MTKRPASAVRACTCDPPCGRTLASAHVPQHHGRVEEPVCRSTQLAAFRLGAMSAFGDETWRKAIDSLSAEAKRDLFPSGLPKSSGWVAERHMMELASAIFDVRDRNLHLYREFIGAVIDEGFGKIRRVLVSFASPQMLLHRAPDLWTYDHSHGRLEVEYQEKAARVSVEHPQLLRTDLSCITMAEMFRAILCRTRAENVRERHVREQDETRMTILLSWSS